MKNNNPIKKVEVKFMLRDIIKERDISIIDLSTKSTVNSKAIYNILDGSSEPKICTLIKLALALNVKVDELIKY